MSDPGLATDARTLAGAHTAALDWLRRDGRVAVATVVKTWGSAPVPIGGQMVIAADGEFHGSVSGGCVEGEVIAAAEDVLESGKAETLTFGVADETAWGVGLPCGGEIDVYVERLDAASGGAQLLERAVAAHHRRTGLVVATDMASGKRTLYERGDAGVPPRIAQRFRSGKSDTVDTPEGRIFYHAIVPAARVVIIGATHIAQLASAIARMAGYEVTVVDPRTAFASPERFPGVTLEAEWPQDVLPKIGLDPYTTLVVVAHVSHIDDEALKIALRSDALYIGALGSSRNHAKRTERLKAAGFTAEEIARIKCPIGLDIGAQTPAEIAIAVMGEVVLALRGEKYGGTKHQVA